MFIYFIILFSCVMNSSIPNVSSNYISAFFQSSVLPPHRYSFPVFFTHSSVKQSLSTIHKLTFHDFWCATLTTICVLQFQLIIFINLIIHESSHIFNKKIRNIRLLCFQSLNNIRIRPYGALLSSFRMPCHGHGVI